MILEEREKIIKDFPENYDLTSKDKRFLALAICGEAGELANYIKKEWRDEVNLSEEIKDEIADIAIYLSLLAKIYNLDVDERAVSKMKRKLQSLSEPHDQR